MEALRELEAQVPAPAREGERVAEAAAPARRRNFRGVRYEKSGKYAASITYPGAKMATWLGMYADERVAACAYDLAAKFLQGPKAKTNFDYPPPDELIAAARTAPGRRGPVFPVVLPPAPAPAAAPPAAPAPPAPFEHAHDFSFKAPPREPAACPVCPFLTDTRPARARLGLGTPVPETKITILRSIPPKPFNFQATVLAASLHVSNPVDLFCPPIHIVMPASSRETGFSSTPKTDPQLRDSASSSWRMPSNSNGRQLMLKTPKIFLVPKTVRTPNEGFAGDNFTGVNVLTDFTLPPSLPPSPLVPF